MDLVAHGLTGALIGGSLAPAGAPPEVQLALTLVGAAAAVAPDLDLLCELRGKVAAWRYHRVALHGAPSAVALAAALFIASLATRAADGGALRLGAVVFAAVASHLVLDVLTSFGTALLFPFSRRRFSTRSSFIVDPVALAILASALALGRPALGLAGLSGWLALSLGARRLVRRRAARALAELGVAGVPGIEPKLLAPWRWLAIVRHGEGYLVAHATPLGTGSWQYTDAGHAHDRLARRHALLDAFLETCDYPRFALDGPRLVVEDVKWWLALPFRPLAFAASLDARGAPADPRQSRLLDRGPAGVPEPPPLVGFTATPASAPGRVHP